MEGSKICKRCDGVHPVTQFNRSSNTTDGLHSWCKPCVQRYNRARIPKPQTHAQRLRAYGLTESGYATLSESQGDCCAICLKPATELRRRMSVDHDHSCCPGRGSCGKCVRGLLCDMCNKALGTFSDSVATLERALTYLRRWNDTHQTAQA